MVVVWHGAGEKVVMEMMGRMEADDGVHCWRMLQAYSTRKRNTVKRWGHRRSRCCERTLQEALEASSVSPVAELLYARPKLSRLCLSTEFPREQTLSCSRFHECKIFETPLSSAQSR